MPENTIKIVISREPGGFFISYEGIKRYAELKNIALYAYIRDGNAYRRYNWKTESADDTEAFIISKRDLGESPSFVSGEDFFNTHHIRRDDPALVQVVEELGPNAGGEYSKLKIVEIPADVKWVLEYDSETDAEWVAEVHRTWS